MRSGPVPSYRLIPTAAYRGIYCLALFVLVGSLSGCSDPNYATFKYKLTVTVEFERQVHTGEGVWEVSYRLPTVCFPMCAVRVREKGEIIPLAITDGGGLFVLMEGVVRQGPGHGTRWASISTMPIRGFGIAGSVGSLKQDTLEKLRNVDHAVSVPIDDVPGLLLIKDLPDPRSAEYIDLAEDRTGRVKFISATIAPTRERMQEKILDLIPWADDHEVAREAWRIFRRATKGVGTAEPKLLFKRDLL